jgi:O-antigen ligase
MMQICGDMIADKPLFGHGAGSFAYLHLPYLADYPEFRTETVRWRPNPLTGKNERRTITIWFKNAHVDLMEYVVEWGVIGCLFPLAAFLWLAYRSLRAARGWDPGGVTILFSCLVLVLGAAVEFHFRIPLVLLTWCLVLVGTVKLADLQARQIHEPPSPLS